MGFGLGDIIGGLGGNPYWTAAGYLFDKNKSEKDAQRDANNANKYNRQREDSAIQRRVADAQKAGIHPLYAMGANTNTPAAMVQAEPRKTGKPLSQIEILTGQKLRAETDFIKEQTRASAAARQNQGANSKQDGDIVQTGAIEDKRGGLRSALADKYLINPVTKKRIRISEGTPKQILEEEYDEVTAFIYGAMKSLLDHDLFNSKQKGAVAHVLKRITEAQGRKNKQAIVNRMKYLYREWVMPIWVPGKPQHPKR